MAVTIRDVTLISVSAVGTEFITGVFPEQQRNTFRIIEIVGGLLTVQLVRGANRKAVGAGVMVGALVGFINDTLRLRGTGKNVTERTIAQQNVTERTEQEKEGLEFPTYEYKVGHGDLPNYTRMNIEQTPYNDNMDIYNDDLSGYQTGT